jgi:hypothetical protein
LDRRISEAMSVSEDSVVHHGLLAEAPPIVDRKIER